MASKVNDEMGIGLLEHDLHNSVNQFFLINFRVKNQLKFHAKGCAKGEDTRRIFPFEGHQRVNNNNNTSTGRELSSG